MNKRELLDRCARDGEERVLLARVLDKLELSQNRGIPAHTPFLSPGEQASVQDLLNAWGHPRCVWTGGYEGAERQVCRFLPDWQEPEDALADPEGPLAALEALFPRDSSLSHRDILGGLMGLGLTREKLGDILMEDGRCQVVVLRETLPLLLSFLPARRRSRPSGTLWQPCGWMRCWPPAFPPPGPRRRSWSAPAGCR